MLEKCDSISSTSIKSFHCTLFVLFTCVHIRKNGSNWRVSNKTEQNLIIHLFSHSSSGYLSIYATYRFTLKMNLTQQCLLHRMNTSAIYEIKTKANIVNIMLSALEILTYLSVTAQCSLYLTCTKCFFCPTELLLQWE